MKKFGFGKEKGDAADDPSRNALFGSRKKGDDKSANPYAQQDANDAYAQAPPAYNGGGPRLNDSARMEKSPVPPGGYGSGPAPARYGAPGGYGSQNPSSGYGQSNPYGGGGQQQPAGGRFPQRSGGYGGMGGPPNPQDEASRAALFGDAPQRKAQNQGRSGVGGGYGSGYGGGGGSAYGGGAGGSQGYGEPREERELTAEEKEEEEVNATKQEIRFIKQQDVASTRNALRLAQMAEETGRGTLERLGAQGERIHNTEKNLDLASTQNRLAEEKARELKTLNRSMFAVHVGNPFTKEKRMRDRDQQIMENNKRDRDVRDATREAAYSSQARADQAARDMRDPAQGMPRPNRNLAERSKYQFEADSEDEQLEDEIDSNLEVLHGAAGRLKGLSLAMGKEVESQNKHIERIIKKTDKVDDEIAVNRGRLDRIH